MNCNVTDLRGRNNFFPLSSTIQMIASVAYIYAALVHSHLRSISNLKFAVALNIMIFHEFITLLFLGDYALFVASRKDLPGRLCHVVIDCRVIMLNCKSMLSAEKTCKKDIQRKVLQGAYIMPLSRCRCGRPGGCIAPVQERMPERSSLPRYYTVYPDQQWPLGQQ